MQATRRAWTLAVVGIFLGCFAILVERPFLLVGAAVVGAWILGAQYIAMRTFEATQNGLAVTYKPAQSQVLAEESVFVTAAANLSVPFKQFVACRIIVHPPVGAQQAEKEELELTSTETRARSSFSFELPVAGEFTLPDCTVRVEDSFGLFTEQFPVEIDSQIRVQPRTPQNIHVGQGGSRTTTAYGEHDIDQRGSGLIPAGLHKYVAGESTRRIDWKTTARHGEPYVREFEAETERQLGLVVDHRQRLNTGPKGVTMLDYIREVALGFVRSAENASDPAGLYTFGDEGLTHHQQPGTRFEDYQAIRTQLRALTPTAPSHSGAGVNEKNGLPGPATVQQLQNRLATDTTAFGDRLRPYFEATETYVHRVEGDPLVEAVRRLQVMTLGSVWTVLFTDDSDRNRIREAVQLASRGDNHAVVFLVPHVLFDAGEITDLEASYERYVDFENFRQELTHLQHVTAFEVGPSDRLETVLSERYVRKQRTS